jgi:hypothetical protein
VASGTWWTNDKIGILSHEGNGHGNPIWGGMSMPRKSAERSQFEIGAKAQCHKDLGLETARAVAPERSQFVS